MNLFTFFVILKEMSYELSKWIAFVSVDDSCSMSRYFRGLCVLFESRIDEPADPLTNVADRRPY